MSARKFTSSPFNCSGARYSAAIRAGPVGRPPRAVSRSRPTPKSVSLTWSGPTIMTFWGFRLRWVTPAWDAEASPCAIWMARRKARPRSRGPSRRITSARFSPSRYSIAMKTRPSSVRSTSYTRTMQEWLLAAARRASHQNCFTSSTSRRISLRSNLTATWFPVPTSSARYTTPRPVPPSFRTRRYRGVTICPMSGSAVTAVSARDVPSTWQTAAWFSYTRRHVGQRFIEFASLRFAGPG